MVEECDRRHGQCQEKSLSRKILTPLHSDLNTRALVGLDPDVARTNLQSCVSNLLS